MRVVLDTCVLVAESMPQLPDNALLAVSSLSYAEMQFGVGCGADAVERARRLARLERVRLAYGPGLAFDDDVAVSYGIVAQTVASRGRVIRGAPGEPHDRGHRARPRRGPDDGERRGLRGLGRHGGDLGGTVGLVLPLAPNLQYTSFLLKVGTPAFNKRRVS